MLKANLQGPTLPDAQDRDSLVALLRKCFPGDRDLAPPTFNGPYCDRVLKGSLVVKDGSRVVSHLASVDRAIMVGRRTIRSAGIGWVATDPEYRGGGLMTRLMHLCIDRAKREGYALSDLEGDRQRYGRLGYELAGRTWQFNITPRSLQPSPRPSGFEVEPCAGSSDEIEATLRLHNRHRIGLKRDRDLHAILLNRSGKEAWIARRDGSIRSYAVVFRQENGLRVDELAGDADGFHAILDHLVRLLCLGSVNVSMPWFHPLNARLRQLSQSWSLGCLRMIKILDLYRALDAFSYQLASAYEGLGLGLETSIVLALEGAETGVELAFSSDGISLDRVRTSGRAVPIPERKMVRLLFGPVSPADVGSLPRPARFIKPLLPVSFHLWRNEGV